MRKLLQILLILVFISPAFFSGCKKYEEGPFISFRSKKERIANTWKMDKVIIDDQTEVNDPLVFLGLVAGTGSGLNTGDSTGMMDDMISDELSNSTLTLTKDGDVKFDLSFVSQKVGTWELGTKKESLIIKPTDSQSEVKFKILKLKEDELWTLLEDSVSYETHFVSAEE